MLALFKDAPPPQDTPPVLAWARTQWRKALDKGHVPSLLELQASWRRDYPELPCHELSGWVEALGSEWLVRDLVPGTREIFCHGPELIEAVGDGRRTLACPVPQEDWELWVETLAAHIKLEFNFTHPCGSARCALGAGEWRATLLHSSVTPRGRAKVFLRQLAIQQYSLSQFGLDAPGERLLQELVTNRENVLVAGSTGSGKTSLLGSMLTLVDPEDHVVLLEDTQELHYQGPRLSSLLAAGTPGRSLNDYLAHSLRLSPDRIILGEMRSHEVVPYLLAMNTGHRGLLSTLHASSAVDALLRVAQLFVLACGHKDISYQEVLRLVSRNVGYVVYLERRRVRNVIRVYGLDQDQPLYDEVWSAH